MAWFFSILIACVALASVVGGGNKPGKSTNRRGHQSSSTGYNHNSSTDTFWSYDSNSSSDSSSSDSSYSSDSCSSSSSDSGSCDAGF